MNDDVVRLALSRFGNGPVPDDFAALSRKSLSAWIDEQLALPAADDPATEERLKSCRLRIHYGANPDGKWPAADEMRPLDLLDQPIEAVASSTAMLYYLSNQSSRAVAANENFVRELFELHTLGRDAYLDDRYDRWREVPGALTGAPEGYIDQDAPRARLAFSCDKM